MDIEIETPEQLNDQEIRTIAKHIEALSKEEAFRINQVHLKYAIRVPFGDMVSVATVYAQITMKKK